MSDHLQGPSPAPSSPGRPTTIARPAWPWSARTYPRQTSQASLHSPAGSSSGLQNSWDQRSSYMNPSRATSNSGSLSWQPTTMRHTTTSTVGSANIPQEDSTRQWSFLGFEWIVRDVQKLRDFVEGMDTTSPEPDEFEILKQSPMLGDNKFKLEIACTPPNVGAPDTSVKTLSLYITSLMVDFAHPDYEMSASMMAAIKCQADRVGERGAPSEWVWEFWQMDWVFRQEHEVWECPLPTLSALLENSRIRDTDSFVICVQIHCPFGPSFPQQPSVYGVPRDLLEGLEASLDNPNTGDVRFVCLERLSSETRVASPIPHLPGTTTPPSMRPSSSMSSHSPIAAQTTARKRIIYAHSDILTRRSEYFSTMLASSFSENPVLISGERKLYTIVVEEADFETIYWLLKFCYANWLLFKENDDPRAAVDGIGIGWNARWLNYRGGEWDWKTFHKAGPDDSIAGDTRSVTSGESLLSTGEGRRPTGKSKAFQPDLTPSVPQVPDSASSSRPLTSNPKTSASSATSRQVGSSTPRRAIPASSSSALTISISGSSSASRTKPVPIPVPNSSYVPSTRPGYPISPRTGRHSSNLTSTPDPHPHPAPAPKPASALSMYQIAHRYAMPSLAALALEHMMLTITPQSSFALLLATTVWDELHILVEDYIIEKWDEVSVSEEFEQCCQEVAAGEWGSDGGKTLMSIFRRLRSPNTMVYARN